MNSYNLVEELYIMFGEGYNRDELSTRTLQGLNLRFGEGPQSHLRFLMSGSGQGN